MGLTRLRAEQISDIDYKQAVRVIATTNIANLNGGAPNQIDGVNLVLRDRVLVKAQDTASENGLYYVTTLGTGSNGVWQRTLDGNETGEIQAGMIVMVTEGDSFKDTQWKLTTNNPIIIGTTPLTFELNVSTNTISNGNSNVTIGTLGGNANVTIGGTANVAVFTTTGLTANNITTDGNLVVGNNLVVNGNLTYVNVTDLNIEDPIIGLGRGPNNTPLTIDDGKDRGTQLWYYTDAERSAFVGWDDSAGKMILAANVSITNEIVSVNGYGNLLTGNIEATGNILPTANITYDLGSTTSRWRDIWLSNSSIYIGNVTLGATANALTVNGNTVVTTSVGGSLSLSGNITGGNIVTAGQVTATGNVTGNYILGNGALLTGLPAGYANSNVAAYLSSGTVSTNILTTAAVSATSSITSAANITGGNITTAGLVTATGNITGGNFLTTGLISATSTVTSAANITGGNLLTGGLASVTGNVTGGNLLFGSGIVSGTGNIYADKIFANIVGNIDAAGSNTQVQFNDVGDLLGASANFTFDKATNTMTVSNGNIVGGNLTTAGLISATGAITSAANITGGNVSTAGLITATGNVTGGNVITGGLITATSTITSSANITGGNVLTGGLISAGGNVNAANVIATNLTGTLTTAAQTNITLLGTLSSLSVAGNVQGGNLRTVGLISAAGNVLGGNLVAGANVEAGNILTTGTVSATGNVTGGNVNTSALRSGAGALTISTGSGAINLQPAGGNVVLSANTYINNVAQPVQNQDAATKLYVDNAVSTAISYHQPVLAATTTTLAATSGGTITYAQPNGVANGIGATLTTTGSFNLIDTANVQTVGTRILVKDEANAVFNGVYTWSNATVITRSTDADTYGAGNTSALGLNDYFFVSSGNVNLGSAYVVSAPTTAIVFGTSNISFAQFSQSQVYTANTAAGISLAGTVINAKIDGVTTAFDGGGNISVKASANLTTPNIGVATGTSLSVTGNVDAGNVRTAGVVTATGNVTGDNITTAGAVTATGNIQGGNVLTAGIMSSTGNGIHGNVLTGGIVSATGNVTGNYFIGNGSQLTGISSSGGNLWVVTRSSGTIYVPILSGSLNVVGRTGNISVPINA